jgi:hypothetical protein
VTFPIEPTQSAAPPELATAYRQHAEAANTVASMLAQLWAAGDFTLAELDRLLAMQARQSAALASIATRLGWTQQRRWSANRTKGRSRGPAPWLA